METHVFLMLSVVIFITFSTLTGSVVGVDVNTVQFGLFKKLKCDNAAVCLASAPRRSLPVRSEMDCVSVCKLQETAPDLCFGVNFRQENRLCDMFYNNQGITNDSNFTKSATGCQYFQVGGHTFIAVQLIIVWRWNSMRTPLTFQRSYILFYWSFLWCATPAAKLLFVSVPLC